MCGDLRRRVARRCSVCDYRMLPERSDARRCTEQAVLAGYELVLVSRRMVRMRIVRAIGCVRRLRQEVSGEPVGADLQDERIASRGHEALRNECARGKRDDQEN